MLFFDNLIKLWRDTFPERPHQLMSIEYIGAIEEFNEYFPGYTNMSTENYKKFRMYYRTLRASPGCMPLRMSYASAMALDISVEEWLEKFPEKRRPGLTGEWAVDIFADHNERVMEKYRKYKAERLLKLSQTVDERKIRAQKLITLNNFQLKWLLGKEEYDKYNKEQREKLRKEVMEEVKEELRKSQSS